MSKDKLNARQRLFVAEYIKTGNAAKAARTAGYSAKAAETNGPRMLRNAQVRAAIDESLARVTEKAELKAADVLAELRKVAFARVADAFAPDGTLLPIAAMPEDVRAALVSLEADEIFKGRGDRRTKIGETKRIRFADKLKALELLGKHLRLFSDIQEIVGKGGGPQIIAYIPENGKTANALSEFNDSQTVPTLAPNRACTLPRAGASPR